MQLEVIYVIYPHQPLSNDIFYVAYSDEELVKMIANNTFLIKHAKYIHLHLKNSCLPVNSLKSN